MSAPVARVGAGLRLLRAAVFAAVCLALSAMGHVFVSCAGVPPWTLAAGFLAALTAVLPLAGRERALPGIAAGLAVGQLALHALFELGQHPLTGQAPRTGKPSEGALVGVAARLVCGGHDGPVHLTAAQARRIVADARITPPGRLADAAGGSMGAGSMDGSRRAAAHAAAAQVAGSPAVGGTGGSGMGGMGEAHTSLADALLPSLPMLLGHLLAALALGLLLRRGDAALFRLVRLSARGVAAGVAEAALVRHLRAALALVRALCAGLSGAPVVPPRAPRAYGPGEGGPPSPVLEHSVSRRGPPRYDLAA